MAIREEIKKEIAKLSSSLSSYRSQGRPSTDRAATQLDILVEDAGRATPEKLLALFMSDGVEDVYNTKTATLSLANAADAGDDPTTAATDEGADEASGGHAAGPLAADGQPGDQFRSGITDIFGELTGEKDLTGGLTLMLMGSMGFVSGAWSLYFGSRKIGIAKIAVGLALAYAGERLFTGDASESTRQIAAVLMLGSGIVGFAGGAYTFVDGFVTYRGQDIEGLRAILKNRHVQNVLGRYKTKLTPEKLGKIVGVGQVALGTLIISVSVLDIVKGIERFSLADPAHDLLASLTETTKRILDLKKLLAHASRP